MLSHYKWLCNDLWFIFLSVFSLLWGFHVFYVDVLNNTHLQGVIDRFETNEKAVILLECIHQEFTVETSTLPKGSEVNIWVNVKKENGKYVVVSIDVNRTDREKKKTKQLLLKMQEIEARSMP